MSDIKKLLTIFNESTTAGSVAVGAGSGKLPADTIFAAEDSDCSSIEMPNSPANFDLWKNSKLIGKQQNSHKKVAVNKTTMYPQLAEGTQPEQEKINNTKRSRLSRERNAGLNEPDEVPSSDVKRDFGTWYFTYQDGSIVIKDGRPLLASSTQGVRDVIAIAKKHGIDVRSHEGAPPKLSESGYKTPKDMDKFNDEDWAEWDAKVGRLGDKAKEQDSKKAKEQDSKKQVKQSVAEGLNEPPVSYREMINSVQKQYTKWYSELANHYAQLGNSSDEFKKKIVAAYNAYKNGQSVAHIPIVGPVKEQGVAKGQELSEEMIADRLKSELALFKKGAKAKDKDLGSKPKSKEVQPKKSKESKDEDK